MFFLNPYDLANSIGFGELSNENLKYFKKRLLAELDLFDDEITIKGKIFSKSNCLEIFDLIESNKKYIDYFNIIYTNNVNNKINDFLYGIVDIDYIRIIKTELEIESINFNIFISPYLASILTSVYKKDFLNNGSKIIKIDPPLGKNYLERLYSPIYNILKDKKENINSLKNNNNFNINSILNFVGNKDSINNLPNYFNTVKSDLFFSIRDLSIFSWNELNELELSLEIISYLLGFDLEKKDRDKFSKDKELLLNIKENKKYEKISELLENHNESLENNSKSPSSSLIAIKELISGVDKSDAVAVQLREISLTCWNDRKDIEKSIIFLKMASKLIIDEDMKYKFSKDMSSLIDIQKRNLCWFCKSNDTLNRNFHTSLKVWKYAETGFLAALSSSRKYYHKEVSIPRCKSCRSAHNNIGFLNLGLKRELNNKKEGYKDSIDILNDWNIGSGPS